jgi:uncharacterized repeat protein (TIGR03803 family)
VLYALPANFVGQSSGKLTEVTPGIFFGISQRGIFAVNGSGGGQIVKAFTTDMGYPVGQFVQGVSGLLYGVTLGGGGNGAGSLFSSDFAGNLTTLVSFSSGTHYAFPLIEAADFNFYGVQANGTSIFYKAGPSGGFTVLHQFDPATEGFPIGPVVQNSDGNFYGVSYTPYSSNSDSLIYKITPGGSLTPVVAFPQSAGRAGGALLRATNGNFYGTTWGGGCSGTIFSLTPAGVLTNLVTGGLCQPTSLIQASDGNIYGASTFNPVPGGGEAPYGIVFRLPLNGGAIAPVFTFAANLSQGLAPASLMQGSDGKLYGVTSSGLGAVFSLDLNLPKPQPIVSFFFPGRGAVGSGVVISGVNLLSPVRVSFGGVPAQFASRGANYLVAVVPPGAATGPITVTTQNGSVASQNPFTVQ